MDARKSIGSPDLMTATTTTAMHAVVADLTDLLIARLDELPPTKRLLIGISGIPASGKSTFALSLVAHLNNSLAGSAKTQAVLVGLDGWHLTRAQLDAFPDVKLAHDRRGAHWTFDGPAYVSFVRALREDITPSTSIITAPSFDHAVKDPVFDAVSIHPEHRIVIIEGLYTFLSIEPWGEAGKMLDERLFIQVDIPRAQERLVRRHVITGVAKDMEEAIWRAEENDTPNGRFIIANMLEPTRIIQSVDDPSLAPTV